MNRYRKQNLFLCLSIFLSGCIVKSTQLNSLIAITSGPSLDISANSWSLHFSDHQSVVYAVSTADGVLFSNKAGDQVLFDGWTVRKVQGMGRRQLNLTIDDSGSSRSFKRAGRIVSVHNCAQWERQKKSGVTRFEQFCSDKRGYTNTILVQESGDISLIRQIVDQRYTTLTLSKLH